MDREAVDHILRQTLADHRLSRGEKRALNELLADWAPDDSDVAYLCSRAFELARGEMDGYENLRVLGWLEEVAKVMRRAVAPEQIDCEADAYFTRVHDCPAGIVRLLAKARRKVDICVFTITDDRIAAAILDAHGRDVAIRIITDHEKLSDPGSDIDRFIDAGIDVRIDRSEYYMHHKFAIFDERLVLTGSYNWTRGAARYNEENFIVIYNPRLLRAFTGAFEDLWNRLAQQ
jgi:phosphatidylserine/phosphatidylglycerophosphate/cardiolipin synthase-like enzyme